MKTSGPKNCLILFDIDGTLLSAGRSGYFALERAIREILDSPAGLSGVRLDGNTDLNAVHQVCRRDGKPFPSTEQMARFKNHYTMILEREIREKGFLMPGINDLIDALHRDPTVELGIVTGNIREGAAIKLKRFNLDPFFPWGAYGCEHPDRSHLVGLAMERAARRHGHHFPASSTVLVGDTIHDVAACKPWGIRCLAVATGSATAPELQEAGADFVQPDLSATQNVLSLLTNPCE